MPLLCGHRSASFSHATIVLYLFFEYMQNLLIRSQLPLQMSWQLLSPILFQPGLSSIYRVESPLTPSSLLLRYVNSPSRLSHCLHFRNSAQLYLFEVPPVSSAEELTA